MTERLRWLWRKPKTDRPKRRVQMTEADLLPERIGARVWWGNAEPSGLGSFFEGVFLGWNDDQYVVIDTFEFAKKSGNSCQRLVPIELVWIEEADHGED